MVTSYTSLLYTRAREMTYREFHIYYKSGISNYGFTIFRDCSVLPGVVILLKTKFILPHDEGKNEKIS